MARLPSGLRAAFTEDLPYKLFALLLAWGTWAFVQGQVVVDARARVRIEYRWPEGLVRARAVPRTLVATINGPQGAVRAVEPESLWIEVDLSEAEQGVVPVDFGALAVQRLPPGVQVVQLSPPGVEIELDRELVREVEVRPAMSGEPRPGFQVVRTRVEPAAVSLVGPQSLLQPVPFVLTEAIDIGGRDADLRLQTAIVLPDRLQATTEGSSTPVEVLVEIEPIIGEALLEGVAVVVADQPGRATDPPSLSLRLRGPIHTLQGLQAPMARLELRRPTGPGRLVVDTTDPAVDLAVTFDPPVEVELLRVEPARFDLLPLGEPAPSPAPPATPPEPGPR